ncbi:MAG: V0 complex, c/d subunit of ATPase, partial [Olpidium bornovanus]
MEQPGVVVTRPGNYEHAILHLGTFHDYGLSFGLWGLSPPETHTGRAGGGGEGACQADGWPGPGGGDHSPPLAGSRARTLQSHLRQIEFVIPGLSGRVSTRTGEQRLKPATFVTSFFSPGIVRGFRSGILTHSNYVNLTQCETLEAGADVADSREEGMGEVEAFSHRFCGRLTRKCDNAALLREPDLKLQLSSTDYGGFLQNEPSPLATSTIAEKATERLICADGVNAFTGSPSRTIGTPPLAPKKKSYAYMIDNVILLITGTLHERDTHELLERCHPIGVFDTMPALCVATNVQELYSTVLVDSPLGELGSFFGTSAGTAWPLIKLHDWQGEITAGYFMNCLSAQDLDEMNIEIIRNTLYKAYLEDFYQFCQSLGQTTADVMGKILQFEADRRIINITINSFGTELSKDDRAKLFPTCGSLYPDGCMKLARADDIEQVKAALDGYVVCCIGRAKRATARTVG